MVNVAPLTPVEVRDVWPNEASDFTPWLADNLGSLNDALGLGGLELEETEASVGPFRVDILATEVGSNRKVVIENQLEQTNHDHLGKVLTYAAGYNADIMIWVVKEFRDEHRQALDWLNQRTDSETELYGVVVRAVRIGNSEPAYYFEAVVSPNKARKIVSSGSGRSIRGGEAYQAFWKERVVDTLRENHKLVNATWGAKKRWQSFSVMGIPKLRYLVFLRDGQAGVELRFAGDEDLLNRLKDKREDIEQEFGGAFEWGNGRIALTRPGDINDPPEKLDEIGRWMVDKIVRLRDRVIPLVKDTMDELGEENEGLDDDESEE